MADAAAAVVDGGAAGVMEAAAAAAATAPPATDPALLSHPLLQGVLPLHETSDMVLVIRVRMFIEGGMRDLAQVVMANYHFWYHDQMDVTSQVFWTENHIIMSQSSEFLLRGFLGMPVPPDLLRRLETYLDLKLSLGMAEFLSPVYYPFTIVSLLNLYDYALPAYEPLKQRCVQLLDRMSHQVLSVCLPDGSIVSPSGRSYARHRVATQGHHISLFIEYLMTRKNIIPPEGQPESALREALKTTKYLPSAEWVYENFKAEVTDVELSLSPTWAQLYDFLEARRDTMSLEERVSTLWSHGAYFHPQAVLEILPFMDKVDLWKHPHFKAAAPARKCLGLLCPACMLGGCLTCLSHSCMVKPFVMGALLTGASLAVHKEGQVLLSSLTHGFNAGLPAFQQWPWAVNMAGIPIWCTFGPVGTGAIGGRLGNAHSAGEMSTARVMPLMRQRGNALHAVYLSATCGLAIWNRKLRPRLRWPEEEMDETGSIEVMPRCRPKPPGVWLPQFFCSAARAKPNVWRWGRKGTAVVAWTVVGLEVTVLVRDLAAARTTLPEFLESIRRDFGGLGEGSAAASPREEAHLLPPPSGADGSQQPAPGPVAAAAAAEAGNATAASGGEGLRHRAPSLGTVAVMDAGVGSATIS